MSLDYYSHPNLSIADLGLANIANSTSVCIIEQIIRPHIAEV
jgi:hypothetical protein